ncbi:MAG: LicD family protein [Clostridia bacterium]|nr:LicD family protein [Clostridia bacterium]
MAQVELTAEQVRKMQLKGLEMALFFDRFCTEHSLTYFLCGGCCIGSIRNGGFIPWDDDVDVFMPRADYEKLKQLWRDTEEYSIQYPTREICTENQFLTICANNTTFIKTYQMNLDINHGLVLDVLPLDGCPTGIKRKIQKLWALLYSLFIVGKAPENHGKAVYLLGKIALGLVKPKSWRYHMWRLCERKMSKYPIEKCDYITELCSGPHYMQNEYPKELFEKSIRVDFEGYKLPIPVGYDGYLRMAFGDYMQLPPKEKQVCHHEFEVMDMDNSYKIYRGKKYFITSGEI